MPKGLCNVGPTFCRMIKTALKDQVGRNVFSYVDDIVMVSKKKTSYIFDLAKTFANMREPDSSSTQKNVCLESLERKYSSSTQIKLELFSICSLRKPEKMSKS
jgi:hypothetical protein